MHSKLWVIQVIGVLLLSLLVLFSLPIISKSLPLKIEDYVTKRLHNENLSWANVKADGRNITISGNTPNTVEHEKALALSRDIWFIKSVNDNINPKIVFPYTSKIKWDNKKLLISANVSSPEAEKKLKQEIRTQFEGILPEENFTIGKGAPEAWDELNKALLKQTKKLELVSIEAINKNVNISGRATSKEDLEQLKQSLKPFEEKGYSFTTHIVSFDNAAELCQKEFKRLLSKDKIYFETGNATIDKRSDTLLQELADTAVFCSDSTILIVGHTDDVGDEEENLILSEQRAKAVKGRLFKQGGVPLEQLKIEGRGSSEPLEDNETEDGRAKNRRIEFIVEGI